MFIIKEKKVLHVKYTGFSKQILCNIVSTLFSDLKSLGFICRMGRSQDPGIRNHMSLTSFILLGLTDDPQLQILIFIFLLTAYMSSVTGNLTIIILLLMNSHLKTAMYFFLQNFSFLEYLFTSACILRFLYSISTDNRTITYNACACQLFLQICLA